MTQDSSIFDPKRLSNSAFDRIAARLQDHATHQASRADVEKVKHRENAHEAPVVSPGLEVCPGEENLRMCVKVRAVREIPHEYKHIGAGLYKTAHALWELRTAEDDQGGYVLVRKFEERATDLRDDAPRDSGRFASFEFGDRVTYPSHGKIAQAVVIMMMPGGASTMVDKGDGEMSEVSTDMLHGEHGEQEGHDSYMDPGHPELADLGPMDGVPAEDGLRVEHEGDGGEDDADISGGTGGNTGKENGESSESNEESKEASSDRPFDRGDSGHVSLSPTGAAWSPTIEPSSKEAGLAMVRLAIDHLDTADDDDKGYDSLPGGPGVTVSDEPYKSTRPIRGPSQVMPVQYGEHASQPDDRAPMGELLPDADLARIYGHLPPSQRPLWFNQKTLQPPPRGTGGVHAPESGTVVSRPPSLSSPSDPTVLSQTMVNRPK